MIDETEKLNQENEPNTKNALKSIIKYIIVGILGIAVFFIRWSFEIYKELQNHKSSLD